MSPSWMSLYWSEPCGLTHKDLVKACENVRVDLTCGECAMLFFTGYTGPTSRTDMMPPGHSDSCITDKIRYVLPASEQATKETP
jgi:aryl-phospho-beta-D-glucosidase BglC (GH1 family)